MITPEHKHIIVRAEVEKPIKAISEIRTWTTDLVDKLGMQLAQVDQGYNPVVAYIDDKAIKFVDWETTLDEINEIR